MIYSRSSTVARSRCTTSKTPTKKTLGNTGPQRRELSSCSWEETTTTFSLGLLGLVSESSLCSHQGTTRASGARAGLHQNYRHLNSGALTVPRKTLQCSAKRRGSDLESAVRRAQRYLSHRTECFQSCYMVDCSHTCHPPNRTQTQQKSSHGHTSHHAAPATPPLNYASVLWILGLDPG